METKVCPKCSEQKLISEFGVNARLKSGISNVCLECRRVETKLFYENNKENELKRNQEKSKKYRLNNHQKALNGVIEWKHKNKEYVNLYNRNYYHKRKKIDDLFVLQRQLRGVIISSFRRACKGTYVKSDKTETIIGCSFFDFMVYIKNLFEYGMTLKNHGEWELDHKIPISSAKNESEIIALNHYTNFQPLWKKDNRLKSNKMIYGN
jgi:hypothetical protein